MPGRPARGWRRRSPYERLVDVYAEAHTKLQTAFDECPAPDAEGDSPQVRRFLEKLAQANLSLRLLRALCRDDVKKDVVDGAIKEVDKAVRTPLTKTVYDDPSAWLICSILAVEDTAHRNVSVNL